MSEKTPSPFVTSILKVLPLVWSIPASMTLCSTQWVPVGQGPSSLVPTSCIPVLLAINILNSTDLPILTEANMNDTNDLIPGLIPGVSKGKSCASPASSDTRPSLTTSYFATVDMIVTPLNLGCFRHQLLLAASGMRVSKDSQHENPPAAGRPLRRSRPRDIRCHEILASFLRTTASATIISLRQKRRTKPKCTSALRTSVRSFGFTPKFKFVSNFTPRPMST
jgi:hypothetical protein